MIRKVLIALATMLLPATAQAQQFRDKDPITIDPTKAYILYHYSFDMALTFIRTPTDEDLANYQNMRSTALAAAKARHVRDLKAYETWYLAWKRAKSRGDASATEPEKPVEPTDDNFDFPPIERSQLVQTKEGRRALKEAGVRWYLIGVPPGEYSLYGFVTMFGGGYVGQCMCMGTVKFEAKPGVVTYIGEQILPNLKLPDPNVVLPAKFAKLPVRPAEFRAGGKFANFFGLMITRISEYPGILRYERDRIIDVRAEGGSPSTN
ncbi:hypothetical protein TPR58_22535 [Sphingomonas sp. HF-S3]|uniref:DUF4893 domain-containing protein n=1 Tax=Sphingomonas rustica TaxID=3103142 RepID=A0ABV0BHX5_9SPHN